MTAAMYHLFSSMFCSLTSTLLYNQAFSYSVSTLEYHSTSLEEQEHSQYPCRQSMPRSSHHQHVLASIVAFLLALPRKHPFLSTLQFPQEQKSHCRE